MVLDIFSIPAMSADPVWLLSSSKQVLKHTPNQLTRHAREALERLKSSVKEGILLSHFYRFYAFPEDDSLADYRLEKDIWYCRFLGPITKYRIRPFSPFKS